MFSALWLDEIQDLNDFFSKRRPVYIARRVKLSSLGIGSCENTCWTVGCCTAITRRCLSLFVILMLQTYGSCEQISMNRSCCLECWDECDHVGGLSSLSDSLFAVLVYYLEVENYGSGKAAGNPVPGNCAGDMEWWWVAEHSTHIVWMH